MRKILLPMLLVSCHSLVAAQLTTADFIQSVKHKQHQQQLGSTIAPTMTLSRTEEWKVAGNPNLFTKINAVTFYNHTDAASGHCSGAGRTLDLNHTNFLDTGIALNGPASDLTPIAIHTSGIIAAAMQLGYTIPRNGQGCAKVSLSYQAGPTTLIPNKLNLSNSPKTFEYGHIESSGGNVITGGNPVNNHANIVKSAALVLSRTTHAQCWGENDSGQLGDGSRTSRNLPIKVSHTLGLGVVKIVSGYSHTCALLKTGAVKCWGQNSYGQLGDGSTSDRILPTQVSGLTANVIDIASTSHSVCALLNTGGVKCWGYNYSSQLGDGTQINRSTPTNVSGLTSGVTSITSGQAYVCALLKSGQIKCWGRGRYGQLGNGSTESASTPVLVNKIGGDFPHATAIAAGQSSTCAIVNKGGFLANGTVECWGDNRFDQLGVGDSDIRLAPTQVLNLLPGATAISMGKWHACALVKGTMECWGDNRYGQLGIIVSGRSRDTPQKVHGLKGRVKSISASFDHTCAITEKGVTMCWGDNHRGQLGLGVTGRIVTSPRTVTALPLGTSETLSDGQISFFQCAASNAARVNVSHINAAASAITLNNIGHGAASFSIADLTARGISSDCGTSLNPSAQCHFTYDGSNSRGDGVIKVTENSGRSSIFPFHIEKKGGALCWGSNNFGQLGNQSTTDRNAPTTVRDLSRRDVTQVVTGHHHACAIENGLVKCWGDNSYGQLGIGNQIDKHSATSLPAFQDDKNVVSLTAGANHSCALLNSGKVMCWGKNTYGQLGNGSTTDSYQPVDVHNLTGTVTALTSGSNHTCALLKSGKVKCWGSNEQGQLGDSSFTNRLQPIAVSDLSNDSTHVVAISAGQETSCALLSDGGMKCWGKNNNGQLGIGHTSETEVKPQQVLGLPSGVAAISVGGQHTCALLQNGSEYCWGLNAKGQLGIGSTDHRKTSPQPITALGNDVVAISTGKQNSCAMLVNGTARCWGKNLDGQLGNFTFTDSNLPTPVSHLSSINELSTSNGDSAFNCAISNLS